SSEKFEAEFQRHRKIGEHLRRPVFGASLHHKSRKHDNHTNTNSPTGNISTVGVLPSIGTRRPLDEIREEIIGKKKRAEMQERQQSIAQIHSHHDNKSNNTISFTHEPETEPEHKQPGTCSDL